MDNTVEIYSIDVPLDALRWYFKESDYTLSDVGEMTNMHGGAISASTVSRSLRGETPFNDDLRRALNCDDCGPFPDADAIEDMISSWRADGGMEPEEEEEYEFPLGSALKLARKVRQAKDESRTALTFSLRKLHLWWAAYRVLRWEGAKHKIALGAAFHLAVSGKAHGGDLTFVQGLYDAIFGREPKLPDNPSWYEIEREDDEVRHPREAMVLPMVKLGLPMWMHGQAGAGKTHTAFKVCEELGREFVRWQGDGDAIKGDLIGEPGASGGSTFFQYGPLPTAMREGKVLIIDEISACPSEVLFVLHAVLEGNPLFIPYTGETIEREPGFTIIACDNSVGKGEAHEYAGTTTQNEALRDRFLFCEVSFLPPDKERQVLKNMIEDFTKNVSGSVGEEEASEALEDVEAPEETTEATAS